MITNFNSINNTSNNQLICPKCYKSTKFNNSIANFNINNPSEFEKIICGKCNFEFCYILCAYCNQKIYMKINKYNSLYNGMNAFNIPCPYKLCEKIFYFTECPKCKRAQKQKNILKKEK